MDGSVGDRNHQIQCGDLCGVDVDVLELVHVGIFMDADAVPGFEFSYLIVDVAILKIDEDAVVIIENWKPIHEPDTALRSGLNIAAQPRDDDHPSAWGKVCIAVTSGGNRVGIRLQETTAIRNRSEVRPQQPAEALRLWKSPSWCDGIVRFSETVCRFFFCKRLNSGLVSD